MDLKQIKDLMAAMGRQGMRRLSIKDGNFELELEKEGPSLPATVPTTPKGDIPTSLHPPSDVPVAEKTLKEVCITSPMVGTFYSSSSPESSSFVNVGDQVTADTVVCIIEAMKVMNEVKAGKSGNIEEVLIEDGHPVEFGTKLFRIS